MTVTCIYFWLIKSFVVPQYETSRSSEGNDIGGGCQGDRANDEPWNKS